MTTENTRKINAPFIRALLDKRQCPAPFHLHELYGWIDASPGQERKATYNSVRDLANAGYLIMVTGPFGTGYQVSGKGMTKPGLSEDERRERKRIRNGRRRGKGGPSTRAARVGMQAANTPTPAKVNPSAQGETVEQFEARGGTVERLTAFWEQAA